MFGVELPVSEPEKNDIVENDKVSSNDSWIINPIFFNDIEPSKPISARIISNIGIEMVGDSIESILNEKDKFINNISNKDIKKEVINQLIENGWNVKYAVVESIKETSILSFINFWNMVESNILHYKDNESSPVDIFRKYINDSSLITHQVSDFLYFYRSITDSRFSNKSIDSIDDIDTFKNESLKLVDMAAINLSIAVGNIIAKSIYEYFIDFISCNDNPKIKKVILRLISQDDNILDDNTVIEFNAVYLQLVMERFLYNPLYNFIQQYLNPSIGNILSSAICSFYFCGSNMMAIDEIKNK